MAECYEVGINILNDEYKDELILSLVHQGYNVYYNSIDNIVNFVIADCELIPLSNPFTKDMVNDIEIPDDGDENLN